MKNRSRPTKTQPNDGFRVAGRHSLRAGTSPVRSAARNLRPRHCRSLGRRGRPEMMSGLGHGETVPRRRRRPLPFRSNCRPIP